jgi:hypothetical protein
LERVTRRLYFAALCCAAVLLVSAIPARAQIALKQHAIFRTSGSNNVNTSFGGANAAGDLIVAALMWEDASAPASLGSVTDSAGNSYACGSTYQNNTTSSRPVLAAICYAQNIAASASNTVTGHFGATNNGFITLGIGEFSGIATSGALDAASGGSGAGAGSSSTVTSPPGSTTIAITSGDLVVGGFESWDSSTGLSGGSGSYALVDNDASIGGGWVYGVISATSTQAAGVMTSSNDHWTGAVAAFKAAGGASCAPTLALLHVGRCG